MGSRAIGITSVVVATVLTLAGCTSTDATPRDTTTVPSRTVTAQPPDLPTFDTYVALGDSFTAGPGLAELRDGSGLCLRSTHNWPSLLARTVRATTFVDVSCIGASTRDLRRSRAIPGSILPAQLDAVDRGVDLVTLGIGGNDEDLFTSLMTACADRTQTCAPFVDRTVPQILDRTVPRVTEALRAIRDRAPDATVLLVGYLRVLPESAGCDAVPLPRAVLSKGVAAERELDVALADAARRADVTYVSMRAASRGHDACAGANAWINGATVTDDDGVAFHPRLAGMKAIERTVAAELAGQH